MKDQKPDNGQVLSQVIPLEGPNAHPIGQMKMSQTPEGVPMVVTVIAGGTDRVQNIAASLMPAFLKQTSSFDSSFHGWNVEEAAELALSAAQMLEDKYKFRKKMMEAVPGGVVLP